MVKAPPQIPLNRVISRGDGLVTNEWSFYLRSLAANLPIAGSGYVIDTTNSSYFPMEVGQGPAINRGTSPIPGSIYFALDTGDIYVESAGSWEVQSGLLPGDVTKAAHDTATTLANVNPNHGIWGDSNNVPVFSVNAKGLITSVTTVPLTAAPPPLGGPNQAVQFNMGGALGGSGMLLFNDALQKLFTQNLGVSGTITFANPIPTFRNLSPLTTKGDLLAFSTSNTRLPVGTEGQVLTADPAVTPGLRYSDQRGEVICTFHYGDATPKNVTLLKAGKVVFTVDITILVPFDDVTATLSVGDAGDPQRLQEVTDNAPSVQGDYQSTPSIKYISQTQLTLSISPGTSTQGEGLLVLTTSP